MRMLTSHGFLLTPIFESLQTRKIRLGVFSSLSLVIVSMNFNDDNVVVFVKRVFRKFLIEENCRLLLTIFCKEFKV